MAGGVRLLRRRGDLVATTDAAGTRTASYRYDPFGVRLDAAAYSYGTRGEAFTARWDKKRDPASQLVEMGARPYDPALGRFYAVDPVEGGMDPERCARAS